MSVALVVFDLAGTTIRDEGAVGQAFRATLEHSGLAVDPGQVDAVMGMAKPEALRRLLTRANAAAPSEVAVSRLHADFVARMLNHYQSAATVGPMPHAEEVFAMLRSHGVAVALNTGFSRDIVDVILDRLQWRTLVDAVVCSDEVAHGRPAPNMIRKLMAVLRVSDPGRVAKVGDTPADLGEGQSAGCGWNIGITHGTHRREQLAAWPHTHLVDSLLEIPPLVLRQEGPSWAGSGPEVERQAPETAR